jgi:hypothetical protein
VQGCGQIFKLVVMRDGLLVIASYSGLHVGRIKTDEQGFVFQRLTLYLAERMIIQAVEFFPGTLCAAEHS